MNDVCYICSNPDIEPIICAECYKSNADKERDACLKIIRLELEPLANNYGDISVETLFNAIRNATEKIIKRGECGQKT